MKNRLLLLLMALVSSIVNGQPKTETPLTFVQEMPTYPGGDEALYNLLYKSVTYPELEKSMNIEGTVFIRFVVEKDGTPTNFEVERGVMGGAGLDNAALFACKQLGKFNPGKHDGVPQRVYFDLPIKFRLKADVPVADQQLTENELKEIEKDAKFICEMIKEITDPKLRDTIKGDALAQSYEPKMAELQKKYPKGSAREKRLVDLINPCLDEAMKAAMEK